MRKIKEIFEQLKKIDLEKVQSMADWGRAKKEATKIWDRLKKIKMPAWPVGLAEWREKAVEFWTARKKPIMGGLAVVLLAGMAWFFWEEKATEGTPFEQSGEVDNLVFGSLENEAFEKAIKEVNLTDKKLENKNFGAVLVAVKNIFFGLNKDDAGNFSFQNPIDEEKVYSLNRINGGDQNLRAVYDEKNRAMNFMMSGADFSLEGRKIENKEKALYSIKDLPVDSVVQLGDKNIDLGKYADDAFVAENLLKSGKIKVSSEIGPNLLDPLVSNFSAGLWSKEVADCNNKAEGEPKLGMRLFKGALMLSSSNHFACSSKTFPVKIEKGKVYKIAFDYQTKKGNKAQYYYQLAGKDVKPVSYSENLKTENDLWNHYSALIQPVENFENINFHFYAPSDGKEELVNLYDNVKFEEVKLERPIKVESVLKEEAEIELVGDIKLKAGENRVEPIVDAKNLLADGNASFEGGLWQEKVGDCCNGSAGEAKLKMEISNEKAEGQKSLKLSSTNHCACTSKSFPAVLDDGKKYKLSFDYKNLSGGQAQYYYKLNNGTDKGEEKSAKIEAKDKSWHHFETVVDSKLRGVKTVDIFFYASSDGKGEVTNLYDNVKLTEWLPKDIESYYLHATQKVDESPKIKAIEYRTTGLNKNQVALHGVKGAFLLIYPEEYSEKWQAFPVGAGKVGDGLSVPDNYTVPEAEVNRQASREDLMKMIEEKSISALGEGFVSKNFNGVIRNDNLPKVSAFATWWKQPIAEELHYKINDYSNAWWIDPVEVCKDSGLCLENEDGSWEMVLVVKK